MKMYLLKAYMKEFCLFINWGIDWQNSDLMKVLVTID